MIATIFHKFCFVVIVHWNNDLLPEESFVVMLILGLDLLLLLMIFCIFSILFALRFRKASLILRISLVLLLDFEAWAYNFPLLAFAWAGPTILKYLEIFLGDLAGIGRESLSMLIDLSIFFSPFFLVLTRFILMVYLNDTFCLKELLSLSVINKSYSELYIAKRSF